MKTEPMSPESCWSKRHHEMVKNGGTWGVPRSGLIFRRTAAGFDLIERMPWLPEMTQGVAEGKDIPPDPAALLAYQRQDFECIKRHFKGGGLEISDPMNLLDGADLVITTTGDPS